MPKRSFLALEQNLLRIYEFVGHFEMIIDQRMFFGDDIHLGKHESD